MQHIVDLRIEKEFRVDVHRFGVFFDIANLFNNDLITGVQTRVPDPDHHGSQHGRGIPGEVQVADGRARADSDDLRRALDLLA